MKVIRVRSTSREATRRLGESLAGRARISVESQQLQLAGLMPSPDVQIIQTDKLDIGDAARIIQEITQSGKKPNVLIVRDKTECMDDRIEREKFAAVLSDMGVKVAESDQDLVKNIDGELDAYEEDEL